MQFRSLKLKNFRNYRYCDLAFDRRISAFVGKNGQGKTNLLEALFALGQLKSFRSANLRNCIRLGEMHSEVSATYRSHDDVEHTVKLCLEQQGRRAQYFDEKSKRSQDYTKHFGIVIFSPRDHELVQGSAAHRRDFVDQVASGLSSDHEELCRSLEKVLNQRAAVLKEETIDFETLSLWTERFLSFAPAIIQRRLQALERLEPHANRILESIVGRNEGLQMVYAEGRYSGSNENEIRNILKKRLQEKQSLENILRRNLVGPQLEDFEIELSQMNSREFSSQGQSRSVIIALKLAQTEILSMSRNSSCVFIADDIASELDQERRSFLLQYLHEKKHQVFLSSADLRFVPYDDPDCDVFLVNQGSVEKWNDRNVAASI